MIHLLENQPQMSPLATLHGEKKTNSPMLILSDLKDSRCGHTRDGGNKQFLLFSTMYGRNIVKINKTENVTLVFRHP